MKNIAIITARGGSKRIPRKNIKEFCGKPIIAYSIESAIKSGKFDIVMVSTDDKEIAEISKKYGAEVPFFRSEKTSDDFSTTNDVLLEVLNEYEKLGEKFDIGCCIYPTAPFVTYDKLQHAFDIFKEEYADSLIPVVKFSYPVQRALITANERLVFEYPEFIDSRSQDLQAHYHDAGQFYMFRVDRFKINKRIMVGEILPLYVSELEVQDIDDETDWKIAELKYKLTIEKRD